jgi:hypothetical protein
VQGGLDGSLHLEWRTHTDGVGYVDALHANALHQPSEIGHALGRNLALVGAAHGATHRTAHVNAGGQEQRIARSEIREVRESSTSLMPDNFAEALSPSDFNHLLSFLLGQQTQRP